jgi:pimeloyl-ACP methyl ester carboxylesterase
MTERGESLDEDLLGTGVLFTKETTDMHDKTDGTPTGGKITQPALFIWGDQDLTLEVPGTGKRIERMSEVIHRLRSTVLAGSGHWVQEEHPAQVNAALLTFLQGL